MAPAIVQAAGTLSLSQTSVYLSSGQNTTVTTNNTTGSRLNVTSISNAFVAYANVSENTIYVYGLASGFSQITVCTYDNFCNTINVNVDGGNGGNDPVTFGRNNFSMNVSESTTVKLSGGNGSQYVSGTSTNHILEASVYDSTLYLFARSQGSAVVTVCSGSAPCGNLYVTVSNTSNPRFNTNDMPQPTLYQYYSYQLSVSGGTSPYIFSVVSGSLPAGLYLYSGGLVAGTPTSDQGQNVTFRVTDNNGRVANSQSIYIDPAGTVSGALVYANGSLVNDGGTIYITYKNTKSGFANMAALTGLGYKTSSVFSGSTASLSNTNYVVISSAVPHPWGSWVKNGSTIYFVHESGLIPIASYDVFLNNGGADSKVVQMNAQDIGKPVLSIMTMNDSRVRP